MFLRGPDIGNLTFWGIILDVFVKYMEVCLILKYL